MTTAQRTHRHPQQRHDATIPCSTICERYVGEPVTTSGFRGTVKEIHVDTYQGRIGGMVVVLLGSGPVSVSAGDVMPA